MFTYEVRIPEGPRIGWQPICYLCLSRLRESGGQIRQIEGGAVANCHICGNTNQAPVHGRRGPVPKGEN